MFVLPECTYVHHMCAWLNVRMCIIRVPGAHGGQKKALDPVQLELLLWSTSHYVVPRFKSQSGIAASALNHWTTSPAPILLLLFLMRHWLSSLSLFFPYVTVSEAFVSVACTLVLFFPSPHNSSCWLSLVRMANSFSKSEFSQIVFLYPFILPRCVS